MTLWIMALLAALFTGAPATGHGHSHGATSAAITSCSLNDGAGGAPFDCPDGNGPALDTPPVQDGAGGAPF